ncbi:MAG: hemolysin family protein [Cytophagales bacterium]|nr:hemolysin family protein [Cytophagales bacterium]
MEPAQIIIILLALAFSALFSGMEIAFLSADKMIIELEGEKENLQGRILAKFLKHPSQFIGTMLIGNMIALVGYSTYMAEISDPLIRACLPPSINNDFLVLTLQTLLSTLRVVVVGEFIPKSIFLLNPNRLLSFFILPVTGIVFILWPFVAITNAIAKFLITHVLKHNYKETKPVFGMTDLHLFIKNTLDIDDNTHVGMSAKIVSNVIAFKKVKVRDCMIPRTEIVAIDIQGGIQSLKQAFTESGHSKILVYKNDIDDIIGYCHSKELFKKPKHIENILTPIIIVPETNSANEVMVRFITAHKSLAVVVDEFGGTSGIVSMEDIIEEIFGEIRDEHDTEELIEEQLNPNTYLLSARHEVDYLNKKYKWDIPQGDYDTLGGFIISVIERIPNLHENISIPPFHFTIISIKNTHIGTVRIVIEEKEQ